MTPLFADTSFYVALANVGDVHHADALEIARQHRGRVVTTEYVLIEVGNWMSRTGDRPSFLALMEHIESDEQVTVVPGNAAEFARGLVLFRKRLDKEWSMMGCISFAVMQSQGLTKALTADHHFEQAGFIVLLK
jgi:hypothetical protein